jgi:tRNA uridine 5-carboxymethylaminomethyl modification enzyme
MRFDALVIGGGHAGAEASRVLSARGFQTALITFDRNKIGAMSCNPAIGGVAKGHLVYEIDALGGVMGKTADLNSIQGRRLNMNRGPAVRSTRVQCDKDLYTKTLSQEFSRLPNLVVLEGEVKQLLLNSAGELCGVRLADDSEIHSRTVVVTSGTFMGGVMFCGEEKSVGGRIGEKASNGLSDSIASLGHSILRLKTGTPARLKSETINFSKLERQWGDPELRRFSWRPVENRLPQLCCYMTYTSEETHQVIRSNFARSPLFSGEIAGVGPRYCPSVEDKVKRFPDRSRHQIFLEPEGLSTNSVYPNGLSTSLPAEVQLDFLRTIVGLESVELLRPGYAVEYDAMDPTELNCGLMSKATAGLFFAGQINRTSGYEEAAAQGLWAGLNASRWLLGQEPRRPRRDRSYLETLVDDLTRVGTREPYRMFTSRSEYRLLLREDNALERLSELSLEEGLISGEQRDFFLNRVQAISAGKELLVKEKIRLSPDRVIGLWDYMRRPDVTWESLLEAGYVLGALPDEVLERIEVEAKYEGYLGRQERELVELSKMDSLLLRDLGDLSLAGDVSTEVREKVLRAMPKSVLELSRISGVTPAAVLAITRRYGSSPDSRFVSRETERN